MMLAVGRVSQSGANVIDRQLGILLQNLVIRHPGGQPSKDVVNANPHSADARPATAFAGFDRDEASVVHRAQLKRG